jgi:leader peptidase (prepilin peptidase) / N-methyltransferase
MAWRAHRIFRGALCFPEGSTYTALTMELAFALLIGLTVGSFLNVCIARMPLEESVVSPRSRCPQCRKLIAAYDNIPILSYVFLGGRCRHCKKSISIRYPAIEALTGVVSVLLAYKFGLGLSWAVYFAFSAALIVLAFIDADHRILPDPITVNGIWVGLFVSVILPQPSAFIARILRLVGVTNTDPRVVSFVGAVVGAIIGGGLLWAVGEAYLRLRGVEGMGFGDVKMMAMVGAFLGAPLALFTIMVGSLIGSIVGLLMMRFGGKSRDYELPFGTFLSFAGVIAVLYGEQLVQLYFDRMIRPNL